MKIIFPPKYIFTFGMLPCAHFCNEKDLTLQSISALKQINKKIQIYDRKIDIHNYFNDLESHLNLFSKEKCVKMIPGGSEAKNWVNFDKNCGKVNDGKKLMNGLIKSIVPAYENYERDMKDIQGEFEIDIES